MMLDGTLQKLDAFDGPALIAFLQLRATRWRRLKVILLILTTYQLETPNNIILYKFELQFSSIRRVRFSLN